MRYKSSTSYAVRAKCPQSFMLVRDDYSKLNWVSSRTPRRASMDRDVLGHSKGGLQKKASPTLSVVDNRSKLLVILESIISESNLRARSSGALHDYHFPYFSASSSSKLIHQTAPLWATRTDASRLSLLQSGRTGLAQLLVFFSTK